MAKNRKTVFRGFSYLQCDDFSAYLSQMAAKGWHFKEFGVGLVFEKGIPEKADYAVEVFTKGSQYDLRPEIHTLDFADYCEAAGWKLIDSKQKICVFKQVRPDAIPILTPEERLQNACKTQHRQLLAQVLLSVLWLVSIILRFIPKNQLVNSIFSNEVLLGSVFLLFCCIYFCGRYLGFWLWRHKSERLLRNGKKDILHKSGKSVRGGIMTCATILFVIFYAISVGLWASVIFLGIILAYLLLALFLAKIRPDADTNLSIQLLFGIMLTILVGISSFSIVSMMNEKQNDSQSYPLQYSHLGMDPGQVSLADDFENSSLLGSDHTYHLFYENASLAYEIYESKYAWVLDIVWDYHRSMARNASATDCTDIWGAEIAYQNDAISYYVRYEDTILVLHLYDDLILTQDQVNTIRQMLELGR